MKRKFFRTAIKLTWLAMLAMVVVVSSCKKDDDDDKNDPNTPIVLDGYYVKGAGTALADFNDKGLMQETPNEVDQSERASLMELYIAVKAGTDGFNIVKVAGSERTTFGPGADFAEVPQGTTDEPKVAFWRGSYTAEAKAPFTVPADGLYHVIIDTELEKVVVVPVEYWGLIGAATPGGWSNDTQLPSEGFDLETITFKATGIEMTKADFKFRYSGGWKVEVDTTLDLGNGVVGVKANTNYGGAVDALVPGGANIANDVSGIYTVSMKWTLGGGYEATMQKTGDLEVTDYSSTELGLVGDGLVVGGNQHNWDETIMLMTPTVENETNYTWTWEGVEVTTAGSFKIREGQNWEGYSFGYPQVTMAGLAADDFETNGDGNFVPTMDGVYDIEFVIDAVAETFTFTVDPAGAAAQLWVPGEYQGWAPDSAPTLTDDNNDGVFTGMVEFPASSATFQFKFTSQPNWDGTNYGAGANAGELSTDGGAGNLEVPGAGTYMITADINNLTWEYVLQ
ncbi:MAG: SusF/SusE family outer membrane protein [Bacteroidales bacterium]|nr:SusF/SusE family outer membrane protein [Bacteroidales bacterium]